MTESRIQLFVKTKSWDARRVGRTGRHLLRLLRLLAQHNCQTHTHLPVRLLMTCTLRYAPPHCILFIFYFSFFLFYFYYRILIRMTDLICYFLSSIYILFSYFSFLFTSLRFHYSDLFSFLSSKYSLSIVIIITIHRSRTLPDELKLNVQCSGTGEIGCSSTQGGVVTSGGGFSNSNDRNRDVSHLLHLLPLIPSLFLFFLLSLSPFFFTHPFLYSPLLSSPFLSSTLLFSSPSFSLLTSSPYSPLPLISLLSSYSAHFTSHCLTGTMAECCSRCLPTPSRDSSITFSC